MRVVFENITDVGFAELKHAVGTDSLRPAMQGVYIDFKEQMIVATDAHILVAFPVKITESDTTLDGVIVPLRFFDAERWMIDICLKRRRIIEPEFILGKEYAEVYVAGDLAYRCKYIDEKYPAWKMVWPDTAAACPVDVFELKPARLNKVLSVLGKTGNLIYNMTFFGKRSAILIETKINDVDVKALVMPEPER